MIYLQNLALDYCSFYIIVLSKLVSTNLLQVAQLILNGNFEIKHLKSFVIKKYYSFRYVICKWRIDNIQEIQKYLCNVNLTWNEFDSKEDILSIVPLQEIHKDSNFYKYLWESNNK